MVTIDHYEEDMFKQYNKHLVSNFKNSALGKALIGQIINHPKTGIDTRNCDTKLYTFYDQLPRYNKRTKTYYKPGVKAMAKSLQKMITNIKTYQPDLVIVYGSWFANELTKYLEVKKQPLELMQLDVDGFKTYFSFNPSPRQYAFMSSSERDKVLIENRMINRFIKGGIENTKPQFGDYKLIKNYDDVVSIFRDVLPRWPIIAVDFETNTLETYRKGAKAIMISLSWKEHQGISIPLNHRLEPNLWTKEQFDSIISMIKKLIMSEQYKVFHNGMYDIRMLMDIYGLPYANNCLDTMLMYYQTVCEDQGAQRGLKHLAYMYTDMGGYEDARDKAFEDYLSNYYDDWLKRETAKYKAGERSTKPSHSNYTPPRNPVDGAKIDFEWLPMETIYKYAAADTDVTMQLYNIFNKNVSKHPKWHNLIYNFYPKLTDTLAYMTHTGFQIDKSLFEDYDKHFRADIKNLTRKMYDEVPEIREYEKARLKKLEKREEIKAIPKRERTPEQQQEFEDLTKINGTDVNGVPKYKFSPSSNQKVAYVLYNMMGYTLPPEKEYVRPSAISKLRKPETLTWKDYKTDRNSALPYLLKEYQEPLVKMLLAYSSDNKMISSVIDGYGKLLDDYNRIHPKFLIHGTVTSRLASHEPNAQNITKPTSNVNDPNYNYSVKGLFKSRYKGGYIFNIDYKSLEVFIATLISKDVGMMQALMDGADIHKRNASIAFDIPIDEVDPTHRQLAKAVN